jgi:hypothetical protein
MPTFLVRIELHPSDPDQSNSAVHGAMAGAGFARIYRDALGVRHHLPSFAYCITTPGTAESIREVAMSAVNTVATKFMILVVEARHIAVSGLVRVTENLPRPVVSALDALHLASPTSG